MTAPAPTVSRSVMLVVAHPDDDAYGIAGSVALHSADPGFRFVLVHATDGSGGDIPPGFPATRESLGAVRRGECRNAWRALGRVPDRHVWLDYQDGEVAEVPDGELADRIAALLQQERPDVVATFGPDGITGHPDHIVAGRATDEAFHRVRADGGAVLRRLLHGALKASTFERWNAARVRTGRDAWDPNRVYHLRGVPDEMVAVEVDTSPVADRIVAGLSQHRSQLHVITDHTRSAADWQRTVGRECFVMAWPPRNADDPLLHDIFEAL
ncbi:PIG-L deacetylase family protein [Arthrobacter sp. CAN_C5]|uniref:PIG-L deacetylase family protein n=1 Tax=Arthrobacter sp. CAN_C5 TaxID=2760706 RepID=UPI001FD9D4CC|nr:PIG-L family deacetylase [Arthrobacter sp. CAN_C5]MBP2217205.1 LmbE family N-acetylglucosaminyl deacetylase [Arthrobacter sp. CAN_C5]